MGLLVCFGCAYCYASTLHLSNRSSFCVLIGIPNLEVSFALNMLSALILTEHATRQCGRWPQSIHQRFVHLGPLVLETNLLKNPIVHTGYKPNCLTTF